MIVFDRFMVEPLPRLIVDKLCAAPTELPWELNEMELTFWELPAPEAIMRFAEAPVTLVLGVGFNAIVALPPELSPEVTRTWTVPLLMVSPVIVLEELLRFSVPVPLVVMLPLATPLIWNVVKGSIKMVLLATPEKPRLDVNVAGMAEVPPVISRVPKAPKLTEFPAAPKLPSFEITTVVMAETPLPRMLTVPAKLLLELVKSKVPPPMTLSPNVEAPVICPLMVRSGLPL